MIKLEPFQQSDFEKLISWIDSRELLVTIAGTVFSYPLTTPQLQNYLEDKKSIAFNIVDTFENKTIGHAELRQSDDEMYKIDKLLIGDKSMRGKGIGLQAINALLEYAFMNLSASVVELNVYDWNSSGIKCYLKAGFTPNPGKHFYTTIDNINWKAFNMTIDREKWTRMSSSVS